MRVTWRHPSARSRAAASGRVAPLVQGVEDDPGQKLREEERRLRRHRLTGRRHLAYLRYGRRPQQERGVAIALADRAPRLLDSLRVSQTPPCLDVVVAHPEGPLQDQLLQDRGIE